MLDVWGPENGVLKVTQCLSETDKNVQNGIKFLSSGLMQAIRNPTAHVAKGKPLTLLNGSNLLHLLEKHGHHAKIDLKEAKRLLAEKDQGLIIFILKRI